jgi:hypothetical protein
MAFRDERLRKAALSRDKNACINCGAVANEVHHIVPVVLGGLDVLSNVVSLCVVCHGKAHGLSRKESHSRLTKEGIAKAQARGVKFGGLKSHTVLRNKWAAQAADRRVDSMKEVLSELVAQNLSLREISNYVFHNNIYRTSKEKPPSCSAVKNWLVRLGIYHRARKRNGW